MNDLKQKVKNTALFTSDEKIEILASVDTFSDSDKAQLGDIVDEYDREYVKIMSNFKQCMVSELDSIEKKTSPADLARMHEAVAKIKSGLDVVTTSSTS